MVAERIFWLEIPGSVPAVSARFAKASVNLHAPMYIAQTAVIVRSVTTKLCSAVLAAQTATNFSIANNVLVIPNFQP